jgi:hypothetical protein
LDARSLIRARYVSSKRSLVHQSIPPSLPQDRVCQPTWAGRAGPPIVPFFSGGPKIRPYPHRESPLETFYSLLMIPILPLGVCQCYFRSNMTLFRRHIQVPRKTVSDASLTNSLQCRRRHDDTNDPYCSLRFRPWKDLFIPHAQDDDGYYEEEWEGESSNSRSGRRQRQRYLVPRTIPTTTSTRTSSTTTTTTPVHVVGHDGSAISLAYYSKGQQ